MNRGIDYWMWESVISKDICDEIISTHIPLIKEGKVFDFSNGKSSEDNSIRNSQVAFDVDCKSKNIIKDYIYEANRVAFGFDLYPLDAIQCQFTQYKGDNQGFYDWHMDSYQHGSFACNRKLSFISVLSNEKSYDGGLLHIGARSDGFKPKQGSIIVFPSYLIHKVSPVVGGNRYSLVGWAEGAEWK